ncbi:cytochrome c [Parapedobacter sp. 2B3]|uniref:cytochrome c n=1 Tax=Parapedobacter sp. 2B3 TaxID=3342381 RepID=UPI0035B64434
MEFFNDHRKLFTTAFLLFFVLTLFVAILPALHNQRQNAPLPGHEPLSEAAGKGKSVFIANGCVACHTQQVRNVAMDRPWGKRPSVAADYAGIVRTDAWRNTATLMGTERTGPDLTDVGNRQPSLEWNLVHLFNPRIVVEASIMPAYPWLFEYKAYPADGDVVVNVPEAYLKNGKGKVVATEEALQLVAYLQSLRQVPLPDGRPSPEFLYARAAAQAAAADEGGGLDGALLYATHCQSCHQANGEGLPGAFPSLKGSNVVGGDDLELYVDIIMNGYDARPEFAAMPGIGTMMELTPAEVAAIINHERTSWGNAGTTVTEAEIKEMMDFLAQGADE